MGGLSPEWGEEPAWSGVCAAHAREYRGPRPLATTPGAPAKRVPARTAFFFVTRRRGPTRVLSHPLTHGALAWGATPPGYGDGSVRARLAYPAGVKWVKTVAYKGLSWGGSA